MLSEVADKASLIGVVAFELVIGSLIVILSFRVAEFSKALNKLLAYLYYLLTLLFRVIRIDYLYLLCLL
jgi:hypothetical protein